MIKRPTYIERLMRFKDKKIIKVLTGIRRSGKSTILKLYQSDLLESGVDLDQIISINFEEYEMLEYTDPKNLYRYIKSKLMAGKMNYVFLDEVQVVDGFQKVVDSLYIQDNIDLVITGSNALLLSGEIATLLSGRYVELEIYPLSFREFVSAMEAKGNLDRAYEQYLQISGFPYALEFKDASEALNIYIQGIYNSVVLKDVVSRNRIADVMMLESVIRFCFDNIGSVLSTKKISDSMTSSGRKINVRTVENYLAALENSFIISQANRFDIKGKQQLKSLEKYFIIDVALRTVLLGKSKPDVGHMLENVVYYELKRRYNDVYIGKVGEYEVDFVVMNTDTGNYEYYQVAASVRNQDTFERELRSLESIKDSYPKFVLTLDRDGNRDFNGIKVINALDWLYG